MRRLEKEIRHRKEIDSILEKARMLRLGLSRGNRTYIVPVFFGYDGTCLCVHTARKGMKIDCIAANRHICFELEHDVNVIENATRACPWTQSFYSVIGFGTIEEITDAAQKTVAMNRIMEHSSGREWTFDERLLEEARLWRISIDQITGKKSRHKTDGCHAMESLKRVVTEEPPRGSFERANPLQPQEHPVPAQNLEDPVQLRSRQASRERRTDGHEKPLAG